MLKNRKFIVNILILTIILSQVGLNLILLKKVEDLKRLNSELIVNPERVLNYICDNKQEKLFSYSKNRIEEASSHLIVKQLNNKNNWQIFLKENYLVENITTWYGFYDCVMTYFHKIEPELEKEWGIKGKILQAAFFTGIVKHLFPFGSTTSTGCASNEDFDGCASNEGSQYNDRQVPTNEDGWVPISHFLYKASIGCCNDYAMFLYMLLQLSGIDARHVQLLQDHVFIEAKIDEQTYILDPSLSFFSPHAGNKLFIRRSKLNQKASSEDQRVVYMVSTADSDPTSQFYREHRGRNNLFWIITLGSCNLSLRYLPELDIKEKALEYNAVSY